MIGAVTPGILFCLGGIQSLVTFCFSWAAWLPINHNPAQQPQVGSTPLYMQFTDYF